ncbi:MAG: hypothetical protein KGR99_13980, partial [Betaproteobacteria bacterium]|nr:hypothetical protein [Betaproteobacteria bacterium]
AHGRAPRHRGLRETAGTAAPAKAPAAPRTQSRAPARPRETGRQASSSHLRLDWLSRELAEQRGVAPAALAAVAPLPPGAPLPAGSEAQLMQRIDAMQQQVRELQAINAQREHELGALRGQLARSASAPVSAQASPSASPSASALASPSWHNALFAGLGALAALLLLLLWQSRRPRIESPWPAGMLAQDLSTRASTLAAAGVSAFAAPPKPAVEAMAWEPPVGEAEAFARAARPAAASASPDSALPYDREAFQRPLSVPEHVQIDEVVDHGHLADFFIGIGDYDKAIDVMRRALDESGGMTSALPYLYLFDLYRRCGRRAEYEQLLGECAGRLNLRVLPWDEDPSQAPRDLVDYPRALALLTESWNSPARLTVVERLIADDPQKRRVGFDLPAYRDLLDLYALARELQRSQQEPARQEPPRDEPARRAAPRGAEALDLTLSLAAAAAAAEPAERSARAPARTRSAAPARATGLAGPEASTLPPLDFAPSTRPPQVWTH